MSVEPGTDIVALPRERLAHFGVRLREGAFADPDLDRIARSLAGLWLRSAAGADACEAAEADLARELASVCEAKARAA